jgi:hypothetical protein
MLSDAGRKVSIMRPERLAIFEATRGEEVVDAGHPDEYLFDPALGSAF